MVLDTGDIMYARCNILLFHRYLDDLDRDVTRDRELMWTTMYLCDVGKPSWSTGERFDVEYYGVLVKIDETMTFRRT